MKIHANYIKWQGVKNATISMPIALLHADTLMLIAVPGQNGNVHVYNIKSLIKHHWKGNKDPSGSRCLPMRI